MKLSAKNRTFLYDTIIFLMLGMVLLTAYSRYVPYSLVWNRTASIPVGLYVAKERPAYESVFRGQLACFKYSAPEWAKARKYFVEGFRLCKPVAGLPGDQIKVDAQAVYLKAAFSEEFSKQGELASTDSGGRPMPQTALSPGVIPSEKIALIAGAKSRSLDSRYLGLIDYSSITHTLKPVITFND